MRPDVAAWIKRAEEDLFTAEALLSFKKPAPWIICFTRSRLQRSS